MGADPGQVDLLTQALEESVNGVRRDVCARNSAGKHPVAGVACGAEVFHVLFEQSFGNRRQWYLTGFVSLAYDGDQVAFGIGIGNAKGGELVGPESTVD